MPRCFLAKKSSTFDSAVKWDTNPEPDENENCSASTTQARDVHHRSTIGSISAAQAVRSIQEPIGMPPLSNNTSLNPSPGRTLKESNQTISLAVHKFTPTNEQTANNNNNNAPISNSKFMASKFALVPGSNSDEKTEMKTLPEQSQIHQCNGSRDKYNKCHLKLPKLQERRRKQQQQQQQHQQQQQSQECIVNNNNSNNLSNNRNCCKNELETVTATIIPPLQNGHSHLQHVATSPLQLSITLPSSINKKIKLEPNFSTLTPPLTTPLPMEILANIKPHPPSSFSPPSSSSSPSPPIPVQVKQQHPVPVKHLLPTVPIPMTSSGELRMHTKEETEAAHDLLELSRSLPPISGPNHVTIQTAPPTPPSPPEDQHYTLIYITSPTPFQSDTGYNGSQYNNTEYPLTPPEQSTDSIMYPPMGSYMGSPGMQPTPPQTLSDFEDDDSQLDIAASDLTLSIIDGRTKKSKQGGIQFFSKDPKSKYTCSECGKNYATSSNLSRHKQTHRSLDSGSAKKCNICGKMYVSMPALSMHILTHNLNHRCHVCGKAFSRPWLLQGHLRSHTGQKPYLCTVCKKCFADRSNLRAHMQTHSPAKNFQCSKCKKTFALKSYLNKHYESACVRGADSPSPNSEEAFAYLS